MTKMLMYITFITSLLLRRLLHPRLHLHRLQLGILNWVKYLK